MESFELDNGMRFWLVSRPELSSVVAGWAVDAGSAADPDGQSGLAHLLEHLMFKGSERIGTRDGAAERELRAEQEALEAQLAACRREREARAAQSLAEAPPCQGEEKAAGERLAELGGRLKALAVPDELDRIYNRAGVSAVNAFTTRDASVYVASVPAEKLELWFWLESDRLLSPVFRELAAEREVIREEQRRSAATPLSALDEEIDAAFWQSHPYRRSRWGWPGELESLGTADARRYFEEHYGAGHLTALLLGRFDRTQVEALARRYFGRLPARPSSTGLPPREAPQSFERRLAGTTSGAAKLLVRFHTVPLRHADTPALEVLTGLLAGENGRLARELVASGLARQAIAEHFPAASAGYLSFRLEAAAPATPPAELEARLGAVLASLKEAAPGEDELERVKNRLVADGYRRLANPYFLGGQLLLYAAMGVPHWLEERGAGISQVHGADVQRVAAAYLRGENSLVVSLAPKAEGAKP
ncbi:MAG: pitrilysin family protein [Thermoanaerobaculia bacterium]